MIHRSSDLLKRTKNSGTFVVSPGFLMFIIDLKDSYCVGPNKYIYRPFSGQKTQKKSLILNGSGHKTITSRPLRWKKRQKSQDLPWLVQLSGLNSGL